MKILQIKTIPFSRLLPAYRLHNRHPFYLPRRIKHRQTYRSKHNEDNHHHFPSRKAPSLSPLIGHYGMEHEPVQRKTCQTSENQAENRIRQRLPRYHPNQLPHTHPDRAHRPIFPHPCRHAHTNTVNNIEKCYQSYHRQEPIEENRHGKICPFYFLIFHSFIRKSKILSAHLPHSLTDFLHLHISDILLKLYVKRREALLPGQFPEHFLRTDEGICREIQDIRHTLYDA